MNYIVRPVNFKSWVGPAYNKIISVIDSSTTTTHLHAANRMVNNFAKVAIHEDDTAEIDIADTIKMFYNLINMKRILLEG